jgi:hypothetical protein
MMHTERWKVAEDLAGAIAAGAFALFPSSQRRATSAGDAVDEDSAVGGASLLM